MPDIIIRLLHTLEGPIKSRDLSLWFRLILALHCLSINARVTMPIYIGIIIAVQRVRVIFADGDLRDIFGGHGGREGIGREGIPEVRWDQYLICNRCG